MRDTLIPPSDWIRSQVEQICAQGVRRPGYPADRWAVDFSAERFREFGLENVRLEPVSLAYWEPRCWSLRVMSDEGEMELPCFPLPHSAPADDVELDLAPYDPASPAAVEGKASLHDVRLLRIPPAMPVGHQLATIAGAGELKMDIHPGGRMVDPCGTLAGTQQVLPFGPWFQEVMEPAISAGAAAYVGALATYPGDSYEYYVPYDAVARPIPGVWIRGSDGSRLRSLLETGPVRIRLHVDACRQEIVDYNVIGELPGADEDMVVIGSHHDGPWASAVEDASGVALVLAAAAYWSKVPAPERPHRLVFLLNAGHMAGGAGCRAFIDAHAQDLERIVLEVHLEHAASEFVEKEGRLEPSGQPEPRWFFTSRLPRLEATVAEVLEAEGIGRSLILPPDVFGEQPTTDGGFFHRVGVPLVNYLTAPFYLFDRMDTLDKIHVPSLVPITRAAIRLVASTRSISASEMRSALADGEMPVGSVPQGADPPTHSTSGGQARPIPMEDLAERVRRAAESILENERLTADLDDRAARVLLDWGIDCAELIARSTLGLSDLGAAEIMSPRLRATRRMMRSVNRWVAEREEMDADGAGALLAGIAEQTAIIHGEGLPPLTRAQQEGFLGRSLALIGRPSEMIAELRMLIERPEHDRPADEEDADG